MRRQQPTWRHGVLPDHHENREKVKKLKWLMATIRLAASVVATEAVAAAKEAAAAAREATAKLAATTAGEEAAVVVATRAATMGQEVLQ